MQASRDFGTESSAGLLFGAVLRIDLRAPEPGEWVDSARSRDEYEKLYGVLQNGNGPIPD
jgi:hypothetical protein